jgi:ADP-ribose pyrophosphatase
LSEPAADKLESRPIYDGRIVKLSLDTVRFPDGSIGELEIIRHSGASAVVPFLDDPADPDPRIVMIRQYRYAAGGMILEIPAGRPEGTEDWEVVARRELEEETGFIATSFTFLTAIFTTPGFTDERIRLFLATGLKPGVKSLDRDEFVETVPIRLSEAVDRIRTGDIVDAKSICGILHVALSRMHFSSAG